MPYDAAATQVGELFAANPPAFPLFSFIAAAIYIWLESTPLLYYYIAAAIYLAGISCDLVVLYQTFSPNLMSNMVHIKSYRKAAISIHLL